MNGPPSPQRQAMQRQAMRQAAMQRQAAGYVMTKVDTALSHISEAWELTDWLMGNGSFSATEQEKFRDAHIRLEQMIIDFTEIVDPEAMGL